MVQEENGLGWGVGGVGWAGVVPISCTGARRSVIVSLFLDFPQDDNVKTVFYC